MSGQHAPLAPSSAARWRQCALSVRLAQLYPEPDSEESREGEAAHWAARELFYNSPVAVGQIAPNGVVLTDEMIEGAELYVEHVDAMLQRYGTDRRALHVEQMMPCPDIHPLNWGTTDAWFYSIAHARAVVFDYKFGHRYVEVFENWQLINYTSGILSACGIDGLSDQTLTVEMHVVQPRSYHRDGPIRTWETKASSMRGLFNQLRNAAELTQTEHPPARVGDECEFCPGRHACEALQREGYKAADYAQLSAPVELSPVALGLEYHVLKRAHGRLSARLSGLEEQAMNCLRSGQLVPGLATEETFGRETWAVPAAEVIALGELFGKNLNKPATITPPQAIKAGLPPDVVAGYTKRDGRGLKLCLDEGQLARKVFGK